MTPTMLCCHQGNEKREGLGAPRIVITGWPNVGKSVLFNQLTGRYVTVSNYPGTTVEVSRGHVTIEDKTFEVIDTPGLYTLLPVSEEEKVARRILLEEKPTLVVHVAEARNFEKMLPLTIQLIENSLPTLLVLNMMDEAEKAGVRLDLGHLERNLGVPVIGTVGTKGRGVGFLKKRIREHALSAGFVSPKGPESPRKAEEPPRELNHYSEEPVEYQEAIRRRGQAARIAAGTVLPNKVDENFGHRFDFILMNPLSGGLILALILYFGIYQFVGVLGAGVAVDFLEDTVFGKILNPWMIEFFSKTVPWGPLRDLFTGEYGVLTLGLRYAVSLILPIVTFFFLVFSVIEDTGYLPRLAMLLDRIFKKIGLSGRAVIPMVLGLGCATMATLVTRTLPTRRERLIATLLLSLAVPCSAQLGVILAILAGRPRAMMVWAGVIGFVFLFVGSLAARLLPGQRPSFYMELPPLRLPQLGNVLIKTYSRVRWYFLEVLPLFLLVSVLIWAGQLTGLFDRTVGALRGPVEWIGLPFAAAKIFLFGFFRRDYGAAGLYDLEKSGALDARQLVVACVALTLFLPCVAQFLINIKERGWKTGIAISIFIFLFAFGTAVVVNASLITLGVNL